MAHEGSFNAAAGADASGLAFTGPSFMEVEGFTPGMKFSDIPSNVWNTLSAFYAEKKIGVEVRFVIPDTESDRIAFKASREGIFVFDKVLVGDERKACAGVWGVEGSLFIGKQTRDGVVLRWNPQTVGWRDDKRLMPTKALASKMSKEQWDRFWEHPDVFVEALPGNVKVTTLLDVDAVGRGEVPIPPLFEFNRPDAPKVEGSGRVFVIPEAGLRKIEEITPDLAAAASGIKFIDRSADKA